MSPPQRPVQRSVQTGQHERHGKSLTAASAVFAHSLVAVIRAVVGKMAATHSQRVASSVNMLKDSSSDVKSSICPSFYTEVSTVFRSGSKNFIIYSIFPTIRQRNLAHDEKFPAFILTVTTTNNSIS